MPVTAGSELIRSTDLRSVLFLYIFFDFFIERFGDILLVHERFGFLSGDLLLYLKGKCPEKGYPVGIWFSVTG